MSSYDPYDYSMDYLGRPRFYGIYPATVISNADPLNKNRIQVQVEQHTGTEIGPWADACIPVPNTSLQYASVLTTASTSVSTPDENGSLSVTIPALTVTPKPGVSLINYPAVGSKVWVMFIAGDPEFPVWIGVQS